MEIFDLTLINRARQPKQPPGIIFLVFAGWRASVCTEQRHTHHRLNIESLHAGILSVQRSRCLEAQTMILDRNHLRFNHQIRSNSQEADPLQNPTLCRRGLRRLLLIGTKIPNAMV
jgi:hypothetical protein